MFRMNKEIFDLHKSYFLGDIINYLRVKHPITMSLIDNIFSLVISFGIFSVYLFYVLRGGSSPVVVIFSVLLWVLYLFSIMILVLHDFEIINILNSIVYKLTFINDDIQIQTIIELLDHQDLIFLKVDQKANQIKFLDFYRVDFYTKLGYFPSHHCKCRNLSLVCISSKEKFLYKQVKLP